MNYRLNSANVVSDTIDGEVLAIRSDNGAYYSLRGTAATVWTALLSGADLHEVAVAAGTHHGVDGDAVLAEVAAFAAALVEERLLIESDDDGAEVVGLSNETVATAWETPTFDKYTDMRDLLRFDPSHEVQPQGWPAVFTDPTE